MKIVSTPLFWCKHKGQRCAPTHFRSAAALSLAENRSAMAASRLKSAILLFKPLFHRRRLTLANKIGRLRRLAGWKSVARISAQGCWKYFHFEILTDLLWKHRQKTFYTSKSFITVFLLEKLVKHPWKSKITIKRVK